MLGVPTWYFVMGLYLSLYLAVTMDFLAFREQFESIMAKLSENPEMDKQANHVDVNQTISELIKLHIFIKE